MTMESLDREHEVLLEPYDSLPDVFENDDQPPIFDPFKPLMDKLSRLGEVDPQVSHQASEITRHYSWLWDAYVAKAADTLRLQIANEELRTSNAHLRQEQVFMERRQVKHEALLAHFRQAFDRLRHNIAGLLEDLENCFLDSICENESRKAGEVS